jgi:hypothetical protein
MLPASQRCLRLACWSSPARNREDLGIGIFFLNDLQLGHGHDGYARRFADAVDYAVAIARLSGGVMPPARLLEDLGPQ